MDEHSITILNPWWEDIASLARDPHLSAIDGKPYYFDNPIKIKLPLEPGHATIIRGARQVGKTTLMKEMVRRAITIEKMESKNCLYLTCEAFESYEELRTTIASWLEPRRQGRTLLCLDEITFVDEWQRAILWLFNAGAFASSTILISGSNARDLKKMGERFPGRRVKELSVYPFSPHDYPLLPCFKSYTLSDLMRIYLEVGGFPHAVRNWCESGSVSDDTYEIYMNWIFGDAHRFELSREILLHLLFRIYDTAASQVTYQRLIEKSPVRSHETAAAYLEHLDCAFLCRVLGCYDPAKDMAAPRKAKKIYFVDPLLYQVAGGFLRGVRNVSQWWRETISDDAMRGKIFEAIAVNYMAERHERMYYWYSSHTQREVDIVVREGEDVMLYEVKSADERLKPVLGRDIHVITPDNFFEW